MNWNVTEQRMVDLQALFSFFIGADQGRAAQSLDGVAEVLQEKGVSKVRVAHALDNLQAARCIDKTDEKYFITNRGIDWIEDSFNYEKHSKTNYTFYPKHRHSVIGVLQDELRERKTTKSGSTDSVYWTKVGAIAAIATIFVTIVLWKLS